MPAISNELYVLLSLGLPFDFYGEEYNDCLRNRDPVTTAERITWPCFSVQEI